MTSELLLRRKWTLRAHGQQVVFIKKPIEHVHHVLMKITDLRPLFAGGAGDDADDGRALIVIGAMPAVLVGAAPGWIIGHADPPQQQYQRLRTLPAAR